MKDETHDIKSSDAIPNFCVAVDWIVSLLISYAKDLTPKFDYIWR